MADRRKKSVFGQSEAMDRVTSPDDLNQYIRVSSPSMWLIIGALYILLIIGLWWAITGDVLTTVSCQGICEGSVAYGYVPLENAAELKVGQEALITIGDATVKGEVTGVSSVPLSPAQAAETLESPELAMSVVPPAGGVQVSVQLDANAALQPENKTLSSVEVVLSDVSPIELVMKK